MNRNTPIHFINETHIGGDVTPEQAKEVVDNLISLGYPSEYTSTQGGRTSYLNEEGDEVEIPQSVWDEALSTL